MTNLTEQWKRGKLPCGWHYIKIADTVFIDFFEGKVWKNKKDKYIDEVLAEVPSYELWKAVHEQWKVLLAENTKLKELLKACRNAMNDDEYWVQCDLIKQIDELLGEE